MAGGGVTGGCWARKARKGVRFIFAESKRTWSKQAADRAVLGNSELLRAPDYFEKQLMPIVVRAFRAQPPAPDAATCQLINQLLAREYLGESQGCLPFQ